VPEGQPRGAKPQAPAFVAGHHTVLEDGMDLHRGIREQEIADTAWWGRCAKTLAAIVLLVILSPDTRAQTVPTRPALPYAVVGGRSLLLDLYLPPAPATPRPVVVWLHDGGWLSGNRVLPAFVPALLARGVAIASVDYRLTTQAGQFGSEGVTFPAQIHDVKGAIRYLRANAAMLGLDPARIGVWGSSSGGHLAALAGTSGNVPELEGAVGGNLSVSSRVQAVVDYYGPTDLLQLNPDVTTPPGSNVDHDPPSAPGSLLIGYSLAGQGLGVLRNNASNAAAPFPVFRALALAASPLTHIDSRDPPVAIVHGTADPQVAIRQSERLRDALLAAGVFADFTAVPGAGHGGFPGSVHTAAIDFLVNALTPPSIAIGNPAGLTGAWADGLSLGQGVEIQWLRGDLLLVVFYGHRDDGSNTFLFGTRAGAPRYGEDITITLAATRGGRFTAFDPATIRSEPWGTLVLRVTSCDRATATLNGVDGSKSLQLRPSIKAVTASCD
jgi:acetyl esterase/lipase